MRGVPGVITGVYRASAVTGLCAGLLANDTVFSFCWQSASLKAAILSLRIQAQIAVPFTAAQEVFISATVARGFTVADTAGVSILPASDNNKLHKLFQASQLTDLRQSNTAAVTPGTRTLDSTPFLTALGAQLLAAASAAAPLIVADLDSLQNVDRYPLILSQNEGFTVKSGMAMGAGGSVRFAVDVEWAEFSTNLS